MARDCTSPRRRRITGSAHRSEAPCAGSSVVSLRTVGKGFQGKPGRCANPSADDGECFFGAKTVPTPFQEGLRRLTCDFVATLLLILLASFSQEGPSRRQDGSRCPKRPQEASMIRKMELKLGQVGTKI